MSSVGRFRDLLVLGTDVVATTSKGLYASRNQGMSWKRRRQEYLDRSIEDEQIGIMADYKAVHGEVMAASPKVFLKYFFINIKTGA